MRFLTSTYLPPRPGAGQLLRGTLPAKNASWLNMVKLELSAVARQCLHQHIPTLNELTTQGCICSRKQCELRHSEMAIHVGQSPI
jgi:hypothetical protein